MATSGCRSWEAGFRLPFESAGRLPPPDSVGSLPHCGAGHLSPSLLGGTIGAWSCPSYI